jgi:hypothetical protein
VLIIVVLGVGYSSPQVLLEARSWITKYSCFLRLVEIVETHGLTDQWLFRSIGGWDEDVLSIASAS